MYNSSNSSSNLWCEITQAFPCSFFPVVFFFFPVLRYLLEFDNCSLCWDSKICVKTGAFLLLLLLFFVLVCWLVPPSPPKVIIKERIPALGCSGLGLRCLQYLMYTLDSVMKCGVFCHSYSLKHLYLQAHLKDGW